MDETNIVCCTGWGMLLVAAVTVIEMLSLPIGHFIDAKADEIRAKSEHLRKESKS